MIGELLPLALGNLARARGRLIMTAGGVLVGTAAVVLLIALTFGLQRSAEKSIGENASLTEIDVYPNWGREMNENLPQLTVEAVRQFWQVPGVEVVIPMVNLQGGELLAGDYTGWGNIMGIDPALLPYLGLELTEGTLSLGPGQGLLGPRVGDNFFDPSSEEWQPVQVDLMSTPFEVRLFQYNSPTPSERKVELELTGTFREGTSFDYAILMPVRDVMAWNEWITGQEADPETFVYDRVVVRATSRETSQDVSEAIRDLGYATGGIGDYLNALNNFFATMRVMLGGVGAVALLVAAFGVANTMTMAILERTKEIGLMKAIGATDRDVLTVFLIEAGLVGLAGGLAGVGLSLFLQNVINQAVQNAPQGDSPALIFLPFDTSQIGGSLIVIPAELTVLAVVLATLVGVGAGFYPALRAAHLPPVTALKQE